MDQNSVHAHFIRGNDLLQQKRYREAAEAFGHACEVNPDMPDAWRLRGLAHLQGGNFSDAENALRRLLLLLPDNADAYVKLGTALQHQGRLREARECYQRALDLAPHNVEAVFFCAVLDGGAGRMNDAVRGYRRALELKPDFAEACNNLGNVLQVQKKFSEAADLFRRAISIKPGVAVFHYNLANTLVYQGRLTDAIAGFRRALDLDPNNAVMRSNLLLILNYDPEQQVGDLYREHMRWGEMHGSSRALPGGYSNDTDPDRALRVGYVSSDFRIHPVGYLIGPALRYHHRERVETYCYSDVVRPDMMTQRLRQYCAVWRDTGGMTDEAVARLVREDRIDILVDLTGHTAKSRLKVFAMKPAPVQVTYLGYPNTTGLKSIDYVLTDEVADPPTQENRNAYCEELVYLKTGFTCYEPPADAPEVGPLPLRRNGHVTFGSLNNLAKLNDSVIALWSAVLESVPSAKLLVCRDLLTAELKESLSARFLQHGISRDRLELIDEVTVGRGHLEIYNRIDVALDPFPWTGHFTTCEALWMGVPVVTLSGERHAARMVASVLHQTGFDNLIARTPGEYANIAASLAGDPDRLERLRAGMREHVGRSLLCDGPRFIAALEDAYRDMWRIWCKSTPPSSEVGSR